jgi:hypothetical protein
MQPLELDPNQIGIWFKVLENEHTNPYYKYPCSLEEFIKINGWIVLRVPIFPLPEGLPHPYVLIDGHHRRLAAVKLERLLPVILYEPNEIIDVVADGLAPFWKDEVTVGRFERKLKLYLNFNRIPTNDYQNYFISNQTL